MCGYYCLLTIDDQSVASRTIKSFECESSSSTLQASSHFDHIPFIPSFYALVSPSNIALVGFITCGYWEVVDEVGTYCPAFKPWEFLLRYAYTAMLCS